MNTPSQPSPDETRSLAEADRLLRAGQPDAAAAVWRQVVARNPRCAVAHANLGYVLETQGRLDEAEQAYRTALSSDPALPEAHFNLANVLFRSGRAGEAEELLERAVALRPDFVAAWMNLGNLWRVDHRLDAAEAAYRRVLEIRPAYAEAYVNLGNVFRARNEVSRAREAYEQALALNPGFAEAHLNRGLAYLLTGDFRRGWPGVAYRAALKHAGPRRTLPAERWTGAQSLAGKTILLHAEQGLGDTIQFVRYVAPVAVLGACVILEVQPPLRRLLAGLGGTTAVVAYGDPLPVFDYECPLMSLPEAFGTEVATIPVATRYLTPPAAAIARWRAWIDRTPGRPRIGVKWSGNPSFPIGLSRSIPVEVLARFVAALSVGNFVCLEPNGPDLAPELSRLCPRLAVPDRPLGDLADTAGLIEHLDLVISIDTSVAHLAGALGKPTWVLLPFSPDWRWMLERPDSPWYPTMRLFRQPRAGDWPAVLAEVRRALAQQSAL